MVGLGAPELEPGLQPRAAMRPLLSNPIRAGGMLALALLVVPGSLHGLQLLLAHAGHVSRVPMVPPNLHAALQLGGFFMVLIWGFLTHALPGMLAASDEEVRLIRVPMVLLAGVLVLLWLAHMVESPRAIQVLWTAGLVVTGAGTALLMRIVARAQRSWRTRPFPLLVVPLALFPVAWLWMWLRSSDVMLLGVVVPIILAMAFRMFAPMMGLHLPRPRAFDVATVAWAAALVLRVCMLAVASAACMLVAAVAFALSLRVFERPRPLGNARGIDAHRALHAYVAASFAFLVVAPVLELGAHTRVLPGQPFYWLDVARHCVAIGFALLVVMGITQRVLPNMVRGRAPSLPWMWLNLFLVVTGLLLRMSEPLLPSTRAVVAAGGVMLYSGVVSFALHLFRGLALPARDDPTHLMGIRRPA